MGKRSTFERRERDFYPTPPSAVSPLLPHLCRSLFICEPCAGDGALARALFENGFMVSHLSDIEPMAADVHKLDCLNLSMDMIQGAGQFVTNPPWPARNGRGEPTLSIIKHLMQQAPTWLLLSADFAHNVYFRQVERHCRKVVSIGRVKWIPDTKNSGKDNCAWYLFDGSYCGQPEFYGRSS